jgi:very-short-patch-repair endonuclease
LDARYNGCRRNLDYLLICRTLRHAAKFFEAAGNGERSFRSLRAARTASDCIKYRQALAEAKIDGGSFVLVPQWSVNQVGLVDLAVFIPGLGPWRPVVVAECDGHAFHERTPEQASKDRKRVRMLQRLGTLVLPFTGTDIVRGSEESAQEIVETIHARVNGMERRWFQDRGIDPERALANGLCFCVPYPWPRTRIDSPSF